MNSQKLGIFCLILITCVYVYFSFFNENGFNFRHDKQDVPYYVEENPVENTNPDEKIDTKEIKSIKIFVTDSNGKLRSVNRKCDTTQEKSCFEYAIKELIKAPTKWEKSKGLSSEIPSDTKILSIRESADNILVDLSSAFESGGGAESVYIRIYQLIKTSKANTNLPVYLYINGKQANVIGGEGIMIKQPLSERSLDD